MRTLPFPDNYADRAIAVHVIEHFYLWDVAEILKEWRRVLKPGGALILELPCMNKIIKYMADCLTATAPMQMQMTWLALWGDPNYKRVEMCHKWGYTKEQITSELRGHGFGRVITDNPRYHLAARDMRVIGYKE